MSSRLFTLTEIENTITEESAEHGDYASTDVGEAEPVDFRQALDALLNGCWDTVDLDGHGQIIAYPADYDQDSRTGEWSGTTVVITPRVVEHGERLLEVWASTAAQRREGLDRLHYRMRR